MDCEKFEPLLLDELYEELDEVTSAAVKRHVSGCARCGSILTGMRSTRRAVALPILDMPAGLEDRILASVKEAQKVVPIQSRASRALSWAGSWAMRPQTAMAAVFLLMIGTSAFVIRSRHGGPAADEHSAAVSVTEKGEPAGQAPSVDDHDSLDNKAAAAAHGANMPTPSTLPPAATAAPAASAALALNGDPSSAGVMDGITAGKGRGKADDSKALASALEEEVHNKDKGGGEALKKGELKKEESQQGGDGEKRAGATSSADNAAIGNAGRGLPGGFRQQEYAPNSQTVAPPLTKPRDDPQDGFSAGMAAYRSRQFGEATRQFDTAARSGDQNAALWAAKSVKDGNGGCGAAIGRFDAIASKSGGTWLGNEAMLESARCQITTGQLEPAREKLTKLANVPSHAPAAQQALNELNQVASRREAERAKSGTSGGGHARPAAAAPRAPAPAAPAKPASADKANGF
jgi:hypothetical protein